MTRHISDLDVPLPALEQQIRELVARQKKAVAELPPTNWRPQDNTPTPSTQES